MNSGKTVDVTKKLVNQFYGKNSKSVWKQIQDAQGFGQQFTMDPKTGAIIQGGGAGRGRTPGVFEYTPSTGSQMYEYARSGKGVVKIKVH